MRMIIIVVVALLLLGGGGAGAYFFFLAPDEEALLAEEDMADADSKPQKKEKSYDKASFEFVEFPPLILPIVDDNGVSQTVSMILSLEVADAAAAQKVEAYIPKLTDAFIQDMYGVFNRHAALQGGVIQVYKIKARLNRITQEMLGEDVVQDVLLQVVQQRPV